MAIAAKDNRQRVRYDLIPPHPLCELARVYTYGASKYADDNWKLGHSAREVYSALMRHIEQWRAGEYTDKESGCPHLGHAAFWLFALMELTRAGKLRDLPGEHIQLDLYNQPVCYQPYGTGDYKGERESDTGAHPTPEGCTDFSEERRTPCAEYEKGNLPKRFWKEGESPSPIDWTLTGG